jgi:hypothetical protein
MPRTRDPSQYAPQLAALRLAYRTRRYLLRNPDVLGLGVGYRFRGGTRTDEPALVVYVRRGVKSRDPGRAPRHRRIPERVHVAGRGGERWLSVDLVEAGAGELCTPVTAGVTTCNCGTSDEFGTVGWVARQADGKAVFCSCYHVLLANRFDPPRQVQRFVGTPATREFVTSPSPQFGGDAETQMGLVVRGVRSPTQDIAIAEPLPGIQLTAFIRAIGAMGQPRELSSQSNAPGKGEAIKVAVGHHNAPRGHILEFPVSFTVAYPDFPTYELRNLISTDAPVQPGDSGSLLLDAARRPLGMLVCRDPVSGRSFFMPIATVMALNLRPF